MNYPAGVTDSDFDQPDGIKPTLENIFDWLCRQPDDYRRDIYLEAFAELPINYFDDIVGFAVRGLRQNDDPAKALASIFQETLKEIVRESMEDYERGE